MEGRLRLVIPKAAWREAPEPGHIIGTSSLSAAAKIDSSPIHHAPDTMQLRHLVIKCCQNAFRRLESMEDVFGGISDVERKGMLLEYLLEERMVFAKLLALFEYRGRMNDLVRVDEEIGKIASGLSTPLAETADRLCVKHYEYGRLACPVYNVAASSDLWLFGDPDGFPSIIKDFENVPCGHRAGYIERLDRLAALHFAMFTLDQAIRLDAIREGKVLLTVLQQQVHVELCIVPDAHKKPQWFLSAVHPADQVARDKIGGALGGMLQQKYNHAPFQSGTLLSMKHDICLYRSLFTLHQLYSQLLSLRRSVSLKLEHSEGFMRAQFYPKLAGERLVLTVQLVEDKLALVCSWDGALQIDASFSCFHLASSIHASVHGYLSSRTLGAYVGMFNGYGRLVDGQLVFRFHEYAATVVVSPETGHIVQSPNTPLAGDWASVLKREAAHEHVKSHFPPSACNFQQSELNKLGSHPKSMVWVAGDFYLSMGIDPDTFASINHHVYAVSDARYRLLRVVKYYEQADSLAGSPKDTGQCSLDVFKFRVAMMDSGLEYVAGDDGLVCTNLPLHRLTKRILFRSTSECEISLVGGEKIAIRSDSGFALLVQQVTEYCRLLLLVGLSDGFTGTWSPLDVQVGRHRFAHEGPCIVMRQADGDSGEQFSQQPLHRLLP